MKKFNVEENKHGNVCPFCMEGTATKDITMKYKGPGAMKVTMCLHCFEELQTTLFPTIEIKIPDKIGRGIK